MVDIDTMVCETYFPVRMWLVVEEAVEVEEAGTVHMRVDSCCLLNSGLRAQAVGVEVHIDYTLLRAYRTADNIHQRRVHKQAHLAAAEAVDTDRMQLKHTGAAAHTDGSSAAGNGRIDAEVVVGVEDAEAKMMHTACDKAEAEVGAEDDERDVPIGAEALSSDEGVDVGADEWDDAWAAERDVGVAEAVARMCDAEPEGVEDSRGQVAVAEGRWS